VNFDKRVSHFVGQPSVCLLCAVSDLAKLCPKPVDVVRKRIYAHRQHAVHFLLFACHQMTTFMAPPVW
jgi:hypothetical protein